MIICPTCGIEFEVIYSDDNIDRPEYCPMCGNSISEHILATDIWTIGGIHTFNHLPIKDISDN